MKQHLSRMSLKTMNSLFILLFLSSLKSFGQEELQPTVIPPSPTASSLIKFAEVPVGYYTGSPNITVPLWKAKSGSLELDISFSYHSGGIKVSDVPGWAGLGWTLNAGGVISRSMQGLPDERDLDRNLSDISQLAGYYEGPGVGYFQAGKFFQNNDLLDEEVQDCLTRDLIKLSFSKGNIDCEPDLFSFNFCGRSGKFVFDVDEKGNRTVHLMPQQDLKIEEKIENNNLIGFTVTDEKGNKYYFNDIEISFSENGGHNSSWCLSKIVSATGKDSIKFVYTNNIVTYDYAESQKQYHILSSSWKGDDGSVGILKNLEQYRSKLSVHTKKLTSIGTSHENIVFRAASDRKDVNEGALKLDGIEIYRKHDKLPLKKYDFIYSYFISSPNAAEEGLSERDEQGYRLRLDQIQEIAADGSCLPSYSFTYYNEDQLPRRNSYQQDWWGFFNQQRDNDDWKFDFERKYESIAYFVPKETFVDLGILYELEGAERSPVSSADVLSTGLLQTLQYPTGGMVEFEYEANQAYYEGVIPPEINSETEFFFMEGLGKIGSFEVADFPKLYRFVFSEVTPTTRITFRCNSSGKEYDFGMFQSDSESWSGILEAGVYDVEVTDLGVEEEFATNRYLINGEYSTYSYAEAKVERMKKLQAGGVRIRKITNYLEKGERAGVRVFNYTMKSDSSVSSGTLVGGFPVFSYRMSEVSTNKSHNVVKDIHYHVRSSKPCNYLEYAQGSSVGYSEVEVQQLDYINGENNGSTRYYYSVKGANLSSMLYPFPLPVNTEYIKGKLLKEEYYDCKNKLLRKKEYNYLWKTNSYHKINGLKIKADRTSDNVEYLIKNQTHSELYSFKSVDYFLQSDYVPLESTLSTNYFDGDSIQVLTQIYNSSPSRIKWKKTKNSKGEWLQTKYYYPEDAVALGLQSSVTDSLLSRNMLASQIGEEQINLTTGEITAGKQIFYDFIHEVPSNGIVVRSIAQYENDAYRSKLKFDFYTETGKLTQMCKHDNYYTAFIWGYQQQYPVAKIENALFSEVFHENFEEYEGVGATLGGQTGNKAFQGNYSLNFIPPTGKEYVYTYWYYQDQQWIYSNELTYNEPIVIHAGEKIDNVNVYPKDAKMETYTYDTSLGMTSQTDMNGKSIYYKYDHFGRLKWIQDMDKNILKRIEYHYKGQK